MKILLVSIAFPPKRDPESVQVARYSKHLKRLADINMEVITSANPTLFMETDPALLSYGEGIKLLAEIKIVENKYLNFLIRKVNPAWLQFPDSKFSFWLQKKKAFLSITQKPDVLYSRSYPVSSTLLALAIKKQLNIPWVLHLSDPWALASAHSLSPATRFVGNARTWNKKKEEECFMLADRICLTSKKTIQLYKHSYPQFSNKFVYMPNVFDDDLYKPNPHKFSEKLTFVYTGGFGEARTPAQLLKAIQLFWKKYQGKSNTKIEFLFTGEMTRANHDLFKQYADIPAIVHLGMLPYEEMLAFQQRADILINIDSDISDPVQSVFFPSKLLDYMVAQRRVLAITNEHSTTYEVIQGVWGDCFNFTEVERLADHFFVVLDHFLKRDTSFFYIGNLEQEFSAKYNTERLMNTFRSLIEAQ